MARKKMVVVDPEKIAWERVEQLPKGVWVKLLRLDEETGAVTALAKFDKGFHEPKHKHPSDNFGMVLEGRLVDEKGNEIKKGMYLFTPAGVEHAFHAPEGCVLFGYSNGPPW